MLHYEQVQPDLGYEFSDIYEATVGAICEDPERWSLRSGGYRRVNLRRFPYYLPSVLVDGVVWVLAVAHAHRSPDYWQDRMPE